jgi:hypothetical protein
LAEPRGAIVREFIIVVAGVLVALAADAWMDGLRERDSAEGALERLRRDVASDVRTMDGVYFPRLAQQGEARERLGDFVMGSGAITDSLAFVDDVVAASQYTTFDASTAAFDDLINNGTLGLIEDIELRSALLDYYTGVADIAVLDGIQRGDVLATKSRLIPAIVGGLSWPGTVPEVDATIRRTRAASALNAAEIRSSGRLRELLVATGESYSRQVRLYERLRSDAVALLPRLDAALRSN